MNLPVIQKPPVGSDCNRCGFCCTRVPCPAAVLHFGQTAGSCRALETNTDGTTTCGLLRSPTQYTTEPEATLLLYVGAQLVGNRIDELVGRELAHRLGFGTACDSLDDEPGGVDEGMTYEQGRELWTAKARAKGFNLRENG